MARMALEAVRKVGLTMDDIDGIGIGSPGDVDPVRGWLNGASNLKIYNVAFKDILGERFGKPVHVENDANAAYGEMLAGDESAKGVVTQYAHYLACGLINIIRFSQPEVLRIGGGISHEGETLLSLARDFVWAGRRNEPNERSTRIVAATLGNDASIIGAAYAGV